MALENIIQKIQSDAQKEIESIKKTSVAEADKLEREAEKEFQEIKNKLTDKLRKEQNKYLENAQNAIDSNMKNEILKKKQESLNEVYKKFAQKIMKLPHKDYAKLILLPLLKQLPRLTNGQILCAERDKNLIAEYLTKNTLPYKISEKNTDTMGGFILQNEEIEINNTLNALVGQLKEETTIEAGKILFLK